jgi:hypothetical protein
VQITPLPGPLQKIAGSMVHPGGRIEIELDVLEGKLTGTIVLPEGVSGTLTYSGATQKLKSGSNQLE